MNIEQLLTDALQGADEYLPSPDLFAKVQRSIEEDAAHRRRVRRSLLVAAAGLAVAVAWVAAFLDFGDGTATMPWWTLELLTAAILVAVVIVLGPLIRRFGAELTLDVFRSNRATSQRFLSLLDIAYYLVFIAFILMTTSFSAQPEWGDRLVAQLEHEVMRVGGLLLVMGILHALTIAVLPVMGLVFASNWRRAARRKLGASAPAPVLSAEKADRVATIIVWSAAVLVALQFVMLVVPALLGIIFGAD
ncbi:MAG: hypothetical protein KJN73_05080 [Acidimicrobiia bacterium]|nr:hypothetical protein [Acidimicrobiia bacterium]NNF89622.1 hypothetical protein [Acidimicrobiia bacterium]